MSQPVEMMLARWPVLYPGSTGDCQEGTGDDGQGEDHAAEVARVRGKVIAPILEAEDMAHVFVEMRGNYRDWTRSHPGPGGDLESVMSLEDRRDDALVSALGGHLEDLGERTLGAILGGIRLRKIVRKSTMPHRETWPEESWHRISNLLADNELCNLAIIHHLATGVRWQRQVSRASTKHTSGAEQKCTTREVIGQRKCPRQLFGRGVTEAGWQQAGRVSE